MSWCSIGLIVYIEFKGLGISNNNIFNSNYEV